MKEETDQIWIGITMHGWNKKRLNKEIKTLIKFGNEDAQKSIKELLVLIDCLKEEGTKFYSGDILIINRARSVT